MKIRSGFVSNSSSSSFIVVFDRPELTIEYLKEKLYHGASQVPYTHNWGDDYQTFDTDTLCSWIVDEMKPADDREKIFKSFSGMSNYDDPRFPDYPGWGGDDMDERKRQWGAYEVEHKRVCEELTDEFMNSLSEGSYVFTGEFGDDCTTGSQLEHGDTFAPVEHIRINKH